MSARRERGYAMIAAVAAVAGFGYLALSAIGGGRGAVVAASAANARAQLVADADAGVAIAIHDLGLTDPNRRWSVIGPPHQLMFQGVSLTITVEDENGKAPINFIQRPRLRRLFEGAGADPREIDGMVEALVDLRGDRRPEDSIPFGGLAVKDPRIAANRGPLSSLDELALLPGMTPALYARIAPAVTVYANTLTFDPRTASPLALSVMSPSSSSAANSPAAIEQARERAGETTALGAAPPISVNGRLVTIQVDAADGRGGRLRRTAIVEFIGAAARPYVMRGIG